eukprot:CAMPEP_0198683586 /NCGR_PEP_ID=MMETSP1468-20131203/10862_1 /TAXON_ID=1461545 /ORGANISM="Mantoniella sp, Strain CCMP1436" /LENGTH=315 /DNA_ID=CAMNT_0044427711 /DNA_START=1 /DNA_END=948 /DNA_ORIENTATION=-
MPASELSVDLHAGFVKRQSEDTDTIEYVLTEHLRMSGVYWGLTGMHLLGRLDDMDGDGIVAWVMTCWHGCGGFGGSEGHDPHVLYTLSAVQVLALYDRMDLLDRDAIARYVASLQLPDGSFTGDEWGEVDTRFSYCALSCCKLIGRMEAINVEKAMEYIASCKNFDGGFGCTPGGESHAGQIFTCVGALAIGGGLQHVDADLLGWWLCERQVKAGGLNGRPEKLPDVCYSWWVLSSLSILKRLHWIDQGALARFILRCQDPQKGGISDRPNDEPDVYHTFFGVAGLSLMGFPGLKAVDPVYALPTEVVQRLGLYE